VKEAYISNIEFSTLEDGIYEGSYDSTMVKVKVSVKVNNNILEDITIKEHQTGLGKKAEVIVGDIIDKQSLQVDSITGATVSSNTIKKAVENALMNGNINH
jgi:uncharacterized protein with FMN-binding domain